MEKKFYTDNFEQLLKENADKFRMYPSKRVWHGIYNNLHPSRRWPSLAIWLLLISSMVFIGLSNRNNVLPQADGSKTITATGNSNNSLIVQNSNSTNQGDIVNPQSGGQPEFNSTGPGTANKNTSNIHSDQTADLHSNPTNNKLNTVQVSAATIEKLSNHDFSDGTNNPEVINIINTEGITQSQGLVVSITADNDAINADGKRIVETADADKLKKTTDAETEKNPEVMINKNNDKAWIEDYAFHNKPSASKWKTRVSYEVYFTPSVGYRLLSKSTNINPSSPALVATNGAEEDFEKALSQAAAVNIELGGNFLYNISRNWNLKAGIQLNYTNYRINAYELKHPTMTTLALIDVNNGYPMLSPRSTTLANTSGLSSKKLNNNTYQLSIPLGADIRIAGKSNFKWYAGATIQPTLILGGNSYLISSDLKNYVTDNSFMRKMNLNAGVESFVSYKTKSGLTINAGPQLRYQLFSTYTKQYSYNEKLYNLGLKIGIITKF